MRVTGWKIISNKPNLIGWERLKKPKVRVIITKIKNDYQIIVENNQGIIVDAKNRKTKKSAEEVARTYKLKLS